MSRITVFFDHIRNACLQENITLEEAAARLTAAGISGTEIEYTELTGSSGKELAMKLSSLGLAISSVYCTFSWESQQEAVSYTDVLSRLSELGIHNLLAIPGFTAETSYTASPSDKSISAVHLEAMERFLPMLQDLCAEAAKYNIQVLMEDFDLYKAPFGTSAEVKWFLDRIPSLGCAFDTGNFFYFGEDSLEVLPLFLDRIKYVHCKDRSLTPVAGEAFSTTVTGQDMYSSAVGSGIISMTDIIKKILMTGYDGTFAIEHFGSLHQLSCMLQSAEYLRNILS